MFYLLKKIECDGLTGEKKALYAVRKREEDTQGMAESHRQRTIYKKQKLNKKNKRKYG